MTFLAALTDVLADRPPVTPLPPSSLGQEFTEAWLASPVGRAATRTKENEHG